MGVPQFYRWLSEKYPLVVKDVIEQLIDPEIQVPIDASAPNPNGVEYDNLYLDMNGIIHPCCHPEDGDDPTDEDEMIKRIFKYIDRIFNMVRPRKLLYMAIDGVAPRAKMNQQRARRFKAAREASERLEGAKKLRAEYEKQGKKNLPEPTAKWDSNVITPGTPFMDRLANALHYFIKDRINNMPGWNGIKVILSDANVPGEGEHKIMNHIRLQRVQDGYQPNVRHVLYGLDADLIMLGLATHEVFFTVLREQVMFNNVKCAICGQEGHYASDCEGKPRETTSAAPPPKADKPFQFLHISILREYLAKELKMDNLPFQWDFERIVDDFVFMCFFVGNDFLPHLPSLEIREGAIDELLRIYMRVLPSLGGYITEDGNVNLSRVDVLLSEVGELEDAVFKMRHETEERNNKRDKENRERVKRLQDDRAKTATGGASSSGAPSTHASSSVPGMHPARAAKLEPPVVSVAENLTAAQALRQRLKQSSSATAETPAPVPAIKVEDIGVTASAPIESDSVLGKRKEREPDVKSEPSDSPMASVDSPLASTDSPVAEVVEPATAALAAIESPKDFEKVLDERIKAESEVNAPDTILLHQEGWKERYYVHKMELQKQARPHLPSGASDEVDKPITQTPEFRQVAKSYAEGLCWVYLYYYRGVSSWSWYYPYHYAPFASDLRNLDEFKIEFTLSQPFTPLGQLMGVLPAASSHALPPAFRALMCNPASSISDFYPSEFNLDLNGKRYAWQAVVLLPFIDERRLLTAIEPLEAQLESDQRRLNSIGPTYVFAHVTSNVANTMVAVYDRQRSQPAADIKLPLDLTECDLAGFVRPYANGTKLSHTAPLRNLNDLTGLAVYSCLYELPPYLPHLTRLLPGASECLPPPVITDSDMAASTSSRRYGGNSIVQRFISRALQNVNRDRDRGINNANTATNQAIAQRLSRFLATASNGQPIITHQPSAMTAAQLYGYQNREGEDDPRRQRFRATLPEPSHHGQQSGHHSGGFSGHSSHHPSHHDRSGPRSDYRSDRSDYRSDRSDRSDRSGHHSSHHDSRSQAQPPSYAMPQYAAQPYGRPPQGGYPPYGYPQQQQQYGQPAYGYPAPGAYPGPPPPAYPPPQPSAYSFQASANPFSALRQPSQQPPPRQ